jgi:DNA-binding response OmpR family regulator
MYSNTILIADTDAACRARVRPYLEGRGYTVIEAADGDTAVAVATRSEVGLVITELYLATAEEPCLVRALRATAGLRQTKVLVYTTHAGREHRLWAMRSGADMYRVKSSSPERLRDVVARLLMVYTSEPRTSQILA